MGTVIFVTDSVANDWALRVPPKNALTERP